MDWRSWSAADRAAVTYLLLKRQYRSSGDLDALQKLYELVDDRDALAALARDRMGQAPKIETTR